MRADPGRMRILMLNTEHGWRGGENQVQLLVDGLAADPGTEVLTVCQPGSPLERALRGSGREVAPLAMRGQFHLGAIRALRRLARERRVDLVHAHTSHAHSLAALACRGPFAGDLAALPLVVTRRVDFPLKSGWWPRWKYVAAVTRYAGVSAGVGRVLAAGGVPAERIEVIHDGIDFARFAGEGSAFRAEFGLAPDAVAIGVTAHLTDHKDHRTLLRAFAEVERAAPQAWLFVVGAGELEGELKALAAALGLRRTVFTGFRSDIANVLRGLDAFTLTSHLEGLGSSLMDAMYCGLPVVATRAGGIPELIEDGVDGLLVPVRDPPALAAALARVVADAPLRRRLGEAARATAVRRFGAATMVAGYRALYRRLLDAG